MKRSLLFVSLLSTLLCFSQGKKKAVQQKEDTEIMAELPKSEPVKTSRNKKAIHIEVNTKMFVRLVFPKPILSYSTGAQGDIAIEKLDNSLTLQAIIDEVETNLDVKTIDGKYYLIIVKSTEEYPELFHTIAENQAVNYYSKPTATITADNDVKAIDIPKKDNVNKSIVEKVLDESGYMKEWNVAEYKKIRLQLRGVYTDTEKLYFLLELSNRSNIKYDIDRNIIFTSFGIKKEGKKRSRTADEEIAPLFFYKPITSIPQKSTIKVVAVFDKFTINNEKKLGISMKELNGERNVRFEVNSDIITDAKSIN